MAGTALAALAQGMVALAQREVIVKRILIGLAVAASLAAVAAPARAAGELNLYDWFDYIPKALLDRFAKENDVKVTLDTYDSNETLLARLKAGVTGYDVAVPSDYMVKVMIEEGMLARVEPNRFANFKNVPPDWVAVYWDEGRHYSVPYQWGFTSFLVDTKVYDGDIDTLKVLFEPPPALAGRINMLKDMNEVINMGLRYLDLPRCNDNPEQLRAVNKLLQASRKNWLSFNSDGSKEVLVSGDAAAGMNWNGFGLRARLERPSLKFAFPRQGASKFADNLVVLKSAPHQDNAKKFLNFMMEPKNAAELTNYAMYSSPIKGVRPYLSDVLKNAPEVNPPEGFKTEFVPPCPPEVVRLYDRIWTNLLK